MANIAFLGVGLLGAAFAEACARRGDTVTAWNRSAGKAQALSPFGVKAAATPAEAVKGAARVHLVLKDDAVVDEVIAAARPGLAADAILIDHSTKLPAPTAKRAARLRAAGLHYLHCPVFMTPAAARGAQGSMLAAGPAALFDAVKTELAAMTGRLEYLGERADLAAANKLFGNAMIIGFYGAMADVLTLAQASGVDGADAVKLLGLLDWNGIVGTRGMNMAQERFAVSFEMAMARKDVGLMLETAGTRPMAVLPGIAARMDRLIAAGHGADDCTLIAGDAGRR